MLKLIYLRLRDLYTAELLLPIPTRMNFGPEDPEIEKRRERSRKWMRDNDKGPGDVQRLEIPYGS